MGDEIPGHIPSDIVFVIQEKPHPLYTREGSNLIVTKEISLREALCGYSFRYQHINGRCMNVTVPGVINPGTEQVYHGLGMPIPKSNNEYGDLIFRFHIRFPKSISPDNKEVVMRLSFLDE